MGFAISFYAQMIGEDEAGFLPSANMYLGGIEGHHGWGKDAVNWYLETRYPYQYVSRGLITAIRIIFIRMGIITSRVIR